MKKCYLLQHSYEILYYNQIFECTKIIGVYLTKEKADNVIKRYIKIKGFNKYPESCFYIDEYLIDEDNWEEGFINSDEIDYELNSIAECIKNWLGYNQATEELLKDIVFYNIVWEIIKYINDDTEEKHLSEYINEIFKAKNYITINNYDCLLLAKSILEKVKNQN